MREEILRLLECNGRIDLSDAVKMLGMTQIDLASEMEELLECITLFYRGVESSSWENREVFGDALIRFITKLRIQLFM